MSKPGTRTLVGVTQDGNEIALYSGRGFYVDRPGHDKTIDPNMSRPLSARISVEAAVNLALKGHAYLSRPDGEFESLVISRIELTEEQRAELKERLRIGLATLVSVRESGNVDMRSPAGSLTSVWRTARDLEMVAPRAPLPWDETFMAIAETMKLRSKDPSTQVGAVFVTPDNRIMSLGYNGMPSGFDDESMSWSREADEPLNTKRPYVIHAEMNAILNTRGAVQDLRGATLYVTHYPCSECAKHMLQAGIRRVVYARPYLSAVGQTDVSARLFELGDVEVQLLVPSP